MESSLFAEFPETSTEDWKNTIIKDLKGLPYEKIQWETEEGFLIEPFYRKEDISSETLPRIHRKDRGWKITEGIVSSSVTLANEDAKALRKKGVDSFVFFSHEENGATYGIPLSQPNDLSRLVADLDLKEIPVLFSLSGRTPDFAKEIRSLAQGAKQVLADYDPFGNALLCGDLGATEEKTKSNLASLVSGASNEKFICVHSYYLRESGSTVTQELAYALAWGLEYLNILIESGRDLDSAAESIWFWTGIGSDYFTEIAKFRALRILWAEILNAYKPGLGEAHPIHIHASTTEWNFTAYDPYVNMLRGTTAAMSAVMGGADSVSVHSFDKVYKDGNEFGSRIARNSQLLLRHESHLDKVEDPSSGSYYLEVLTKKLSEVAWAKFQEIEKEGGFHKSLLNGTIQSQVDLSAKKKRESVSTRKQTLLGTNQYPLSSERQIELKHSISKTEKKISVPNEGKYKRLNPLRVSYDFDRLRNATDVYFEKNKSVPKVFLLTIGNLGMRKARAAFGLNYIGCLGYEIIDNLGFTSVEEGVQAAKKANADIVVLCSSDEEYAEFIPQFADSMKTILPKAWKIVAGYPKDLISIAEEKGIEDFIHLKRNLVEFMEKAQKKLGLI
ncbi:methylmalonyl-CoA mutase family protein [Leptospira idonii]|uniref:Methylmalonyl-CoA mutase n=1 Tax=Leptospira idonii TaxID=1193500 RepID=A0A4R9M1S3_9LEPT|nr:methylmalonyl-CoA mutase family protein [Leptospira idonii]TGN19647.1 methylmalonyl-CoA mutase [Leptospira idonii]